MEILNFLKKCLLIIPPAMIHIMNNINPEVVRQILKFDELNVQLDSYYDAAKDDEKELDVLERQIQQIEFTMSNIKKAQREHNTKISKMFDDISNEYSLDQFSDEIKQQLKFKRENEALQIINKVIQ